MEWSSNATARIMPRRIPAASQRGLLAAAETASHCPATGTMAISETSLRDVLLFTVDEINAAGGVMGKKIEPVVVDGASNWPLFAEKSKQLLDQDKVAVTFGCWTSVSRKSVLPLFEEKKGLLFYPVQYEGEERSGVKGAGSKERGRSSRINRSCYFSSSRFFS